MSIATRHLSQEAREIAPIVIPISFESGETVTGLQVPTPPSAEFRLVAVRYEVIKALAATNAGTIDVKDAAGNAAITQISIPASSALGTRGSATLSTTDATLRVGPGQPNGSYHAVTSAKGAAGGKALLFLYYRRIQPASAQN